MTTPASGLLVGLWGYSDSEEPKGIALKFVIAGKSTEQICLTFAMAHDLQRLLSKKLKEGKVKW